MLGVCLLFVGIVLINNGMCTLYHVDGRSAAVMNIFTGGLSLFINFVNLVQGNYYAAGTGLLFCFTYLFVAVNKFLNASPIPFAWFSTFVAVNAAHLRNDRRLHWKRGAWHHAGSPLGGHLVSVGDSLGYFFCGGYLRKEARKICAVPSGI